MADITILSNSFHMFLLELTYPFHDLNYYGILCASSSNPTPKASPIVFFSPSKWEKKSMVGNWSGVISKILPTSRSTHG